jgi:selenide,water dikinase
MTAPLRLVLAGGGHSQVEVLRQIAMTPLTGVSLTLVTRDVLAPYSGMLPGFIAGHYEYDECHVDVRALARMAGARICHAEVEGLDLTNKTVLCKGRPAIPFDLLSLNVGSRPAVAEVPGAREFAWPAKPVDEFIRRWQALLAGLEARPRPHGVVVVGAGAGGVELVLAMQYRLARISKATRFALVSSSAEILPSHNARVRRRVERVLQERGIEVHRAQTAAEVTLDSVRCTSGLEIAYDTLAWTTHAAPAPWLRNSGLAVDQAGFVSVNDHLQSVSHPFVFAAGDVASLADNPRPKSGVFAVREGPYLARNLRNAAAGRPLETFRPQTQHLGLISTGDRAAIASRGGWSAQGPWVWRWKDRVDRKWMDRYRFVVPSMAGPMASGDEMPCAGCGAKLGHEILERALARLQTVRRSDVLVGLDAPDDAAVIEMPPGKLAVHSVDFFPPLVDDAFLAGKIAAVHCLSDLYAMGATPHTALAMVTLPRGGPADAEDELAELLAGALSVLMPEHTALVGGHTLQGDAPFFGLSVNGWIDRERLLTRRAPAPGDHLVLTKPLGIGAIFAADMRGLAQNDWLAAAITVMIQSNAAAARILSNHSAAACTDVTGFGLAGHLLRVLRQARLAATLDIGRVPAIPGAVTASAAGIRSSLHPANASAANDMAASLAALDAPVYPLLFDPQTAGGFVAALPPDRSEACLEALRAAGYIYAEVIGALCPHETGGPRLSLT